jgi:hypothetical protein
VTTDVTISWTSYDGGYVVRQGRAILVPFTVRPMRAAGRALLDDGVDPQEVLRIRETGGNVLVTSTVGEAARSPGPLLIPYPDSLIKMTGPPMVTPRSWDFV